MAEFPRTNSHRQNCQDSYQNVYQYGTAPRERSETSAFVAYAAEDTYDLCAIRFDKWFKCDSLHGGNEQDEREAKALRDGTFDEVESYPCYRQFYEASHACADDIFDYLMEMNYFRRANGFSESDVQAHELKRFPLIYDTPKYQDKKTFTY